jgi:hypothetical protein
MVKEAFGVTLTATPYPRAGLRIIEETGSGFKMETDNDHCSTSWEQSFPWMSKEELETFFANVAFPHDSFTIDPYYYYTCAGPSPQAKSISYQFLGAIFFQIDAKEQIFETDSYQLNLERPEEIHHYHFFATADQTHRMIKRSEKTH